MSNSELCENIKQNLDAQGIHISKAEVQNLYASVLESISEIINEGDIIDISDFGAFWQRGGSVFFRPSDEILERINNT